MNPSTKGMNDGKKDVHEEGPGGKTPEGTLYASILRALNTKGKDARFKKTDRGQFTLAGRK